MTAITAGTGDTIYAAYGDMSFAQLGCWHGAVQRPRVAGPTAQRRAALADPGRRLVAVGDSFLTLLNGADGDWQTVAHFRLKSRYRSPDFADPMALLADEGTGQLLWFAPTTDTGSIISLPGTSYLVRPRQARLYSRVVRPCRRAPR